MVKGKMKLVFADIMRELKASGYRVSARLLNAMYFNVPQSRQRLIFIGVRDDLGIEPSHPRAQSRPIIAKNAIKGACEYIPHRGMTELQKQRWHEIAPGKAHHERFSFKKLNPNEVSNTIIKTAGSGGLSHYAMPRFLSIGEIRRIGSFPDSYTLVGDWTTALERIGNSVPPLFMRAIAEHIRREILNKTQEHA